MKFQLFVFAMGSAAVCAAESPNVILLVADDLGYGDLSCYGAERTPTPRVDSLARGGVRFTNCHSVAATSTPSRYSLLTGEYCFRRPDTDIAPGDEAMLIHPEQFTIADMFRSAGYATAAIGKWHLGLGSERGRQNWNGELDRTPADIGFDYHFLMAATADRVPCVFFEQGRVADYDSRYPIYVSYERNFPGEPTGKDSPELLTKLRPTFGHNQSIVNGISRIGYMKGGGKALWRDEDIADRLADAAIGFVGAHADEPFFMYLGTNDVHVPRYPHERFRGKSPMGLRGEAIMQFDYTVGRLLDALDSLGLRDNTLIILTSDNGPVLDDGYHDRAAELAGTHRPAGPWRGGKYSALEGGTAVPLIVNWPAGARHGAESHALLSLIDIMASMGELTGAQIPSGAAPDSRSRLATLLGHDERGSEFVYEMASDRTMSVRTARWKYISPSDGPAVQADGDVETGYSRSPQLYDLESDPRETVNLYGELPEIAAELEQRLEEASLPSVHAETGNPQPCEVYDLSGRRVDAKRGLSPGLYVGRGSKRIISGGSSLR